MVEIISANNELMKKADFEKKYQKLYILASDQLKTTLVSKTKITLLSLAACCANYS